MNQVEQDKRPEDVQKRFEVVKAAEAALASSKVDADFEADVIKKEYEYRVAEEAKRRRLEANSLPTVATFSGDIMDLIADSDDEDFDWIIPDRLAREERIILTGFEGGGKSEWSRQSAVRLASGLHPFLDVDAPAKRSLYINLENPTTLEKVAFRKLIKLTEGRFNPSLFTMRLFEAGMDLTSDADKAKLIALVEEHKPDVLFIGPSYKMCSIDPSDPTHAMTIIRVLDYIRVTYHCAVVVEQHCPHTTDDATKARTRRPNGTSTWLRWPEFGMFIGHLRDAPPNEYIQEHWRGARAQGRAWSEKLYKNDPSGWSWVEKASDHTESMLEETTTKKLSKQEQAMEYKFEHPAATHVQIQKALNISQASESKGWALWEVEAARRAIEQLQADT